MHFHVGFHADFDMIEVRRIDSEFVVHRLEEAGRSLIALPSKGCKPAGFGSGWPQIVHAAAEAYGYDPTDVRPDPPSADAIDRMDEAFRWISLIPEWEADIRKIVLMRAMVNPVTERHRFSWRRISQIQNVNHETIRRRHAAAISTIVLGIKRRPELCRCVQELM